MLKLTVGKKITGGFIIVVGMVTIMSIFTYFKIGEINTSYEDIINSNLSKIDMAQGLAADIANEAVAMRRFNFTGDISDIQIFNDYRKKSDEKLDQLSKLMQTENGGKITQTIKSEKKSYETIAENSIEAKKNNNIEQVALHMQQAGKPYKAAMVATEQLVQSVKVFVEDEQKRQAEQAKHAQIILLIANIIVALVAIAIGLVVSRSIVNPLRRITSTANEVATGNLAQADIVVHSSDEIGQVANTFNTMKGNLRQLIKQIVTTTEQIAASSEQLTASAEQTAQATNQVAMTISEVAEGAEKQANAVDTTAAVVEQMSASIQQVAANANSVSGVADKAASAAAQGNTVVNVAMKQMGTIEKTVSSSAQVVTNLGERSKEIGQIVDTISGIAGQTNLLALNAAIEAARAGEQGRGFAVVAEEVRKLAEQSQQAAKQIANLISEIQDETDRAVMAMNKGAQEVKVGAEVVNNAGQAFKDIVSLIGEVSSQSREITAAIQQMASGSQLIVASVQGIDTISKGTAAQTQTVSAATEEQSATMEEIAASSQALARMAEDLQGAVRKFRI